jgi:hypothetical protein
VDAHLDAASRAQHSVSIITFVIHGSTFKNFFRTATSTPCKRTDTPASGGLVTWQGFPESPKS